MKTLLIFSTPSQKTEQWTNLPFIPRINELINLQDLLTEDDIKTIEKSAGCPTITKGIVKTVEYRHDDNDFYVELLIWCDILNPK